MLDVRRSRGGTATGGKSQSRVKANAFLSNRKNARSEFDSRVWNFSFASLSYLYSKRIPLTFERQRLGTPRSHAITQDGANEASKRKNAAGRDSEFHHG